ncbi:MAG TPA: hypothetical protein VGB13_10935 [Candidatus Krumholzibacteria bacterium]
MPAPPPLPVAPSILQIAELAEKLARSIPKDSRRTLYQALDAALAGKPTVAARLLKLNAETRAIILAGGGKLTR